MTEAFDPEIVIRGRLRAAAVPSAREISLYMAHPHSALGSLDLTTPPYWAHPWGGGLVLARYLLDRPETVRGLRVLDLGCGSGVVAIAAALAGAAIEAADIDPFAVAATRVNAALNGVRVSTVEEDLTLSAIPDVELIVAGDVFYDPAVAERMADFLGRCVAAGITVLVGDPGRRDLPRRRLRLLAASDAPDFGGATGPSGVYDFEG